MKNKTAEVLDMEYCQKYSHLPNTEEELLEHLQNTLKLNMDKIQQEEERIKNIPWAELDFILPVIPKGSARPRTSANSSHFYVPGAAANRKLVRKHIDVNNVIYTRTTLIVQTFQPTPVSIMNREEIYLAEKRLIEPLADPDWDNLGKTYSDMLQEQVLINDNIISTGIVQKYYSIKPRVVLRLLYQEGFDSNFNEKRMKKTKAYLNAVDMNLVKEIYTSK